MRLALRVYRAYFGLSRVPFAITLGGQRLYVVTSPDDVATVYQNTRTLSWDALLDDLLIGFGVSKSSIVLLWQQLPVEVLAASRQSTHDKTPHLSSVHSMLDLYKRQLLPGPKSNVLISTMIRHLEESLYWPKLCSSYYTSKQPRLYRISLMQFCSEILVNATTRTLFGNTIYKIDPKTTRNLIDFNEHAWMLIFKYPHSAKSSLGLARKNLLRTFTQYLQESSHARKDQA